MRASIVDSSKLKPQEVAYFCFPPSQRKAKNKTSALRAQRLCGENEY
jgi:hypothetical protein